MPTDADPTPLSGDAAAGRRSPASCGRRAVLAAAESARDDHSAATARPVICVPYDTSPRSCCAPRASPTSATCRRRRRQTRRIRSRHGRDRFQRQLRARYMIAAIDRGDPDHGARRPACRLLRIVRAWRHPRHRRPQRQERRHSVPGSPPHLFLSVIAANVGVDPVKDIHWITTTAKVPAEQLFIDGKVEPSWVFRRSRRSCTPARSAMSSSTARRTSRGRNISAACWPATRSSCAEYPVATKRVMRADPEGRPISAPAEPARVARLLVDGGFTARYEYALQTLQRDALRQMARVRRRGHDPFLCAAPARAGLIKSSPQKIIADGTDWRFLNELKRELKA